MWVEVNPQNSQKLEPAKFSCYTVADWNLRVRSNVLSCFINSKFLHECNQSLSWTQQSKVWNDLDSTITIKMFFPKYQNYARSVFGTPLYPWPEVNFVWEGVVDGDVMAYQTVQNCRKLSLVYSYTDFYPGKTDLPRANSSKISQGKFISGFVLPR